MTEFDEESYLESLLESIGDVEDIVSTEKIGVEKMLEDMNQEPEPEPEPEPVPQKEYANEYEKGLDMMAGDVYSTVPSRRNRLHTEKFGI